jgi:uncharacterized protein YbjT (DUF2867 family)
MKTALVFGASGLSGSALLKQLLLDKRYGVVKVFNRKALGMAHPKLTEVITDYSNLETIASEIKGDIVFSCLGTTIAKAGSKQAQQIVDRDYPIAVAKIAAQNKVDYFVAVSSVGAHITANNFYLKTKGEMESGIAQYYKAKLFFLRPSFLMGSRQELRIGEKTGIVFFKLIGPFFFGATKKYRGMPVDMLARAMVNLVFKSAPSILEYDQIMEVSKLE